MPNTYKMMAKLKTGVQIRTPDTSGIQIPGEEKNFSLEEKLRSFLIFLAKRKNVPYSTQTFILFCIKLSSLLVFFCLSRIEYLLSVHREEAAMQISQEELVRINFVQVGRNK